MPSVRLVSERLYFEAIGINEPGTTNVTKEENLWKGKKLAQWQGRKRVTYICNDTVVKSVAVITYLLGAQSFVIAQGKGANRAGKSEKKIGKGYSGNFSFILRRRNRESGTLPVSKVQLHDREPNYYLILTIITKLQTLKTQSIADVNHFRLVSL